MSSQVDFSKHESEGHAEGLQPVATAQGSAKNVMHCNLAVTVFLLPK
jgi:hypothetical protein